jgi:hypothetical protein
MLPCIIAVVVGGCAATSSLVDRPGALLTTSSNEAGIAVKDPQQGSPYLFGSDIVCLDRPGMVTVESVEFEGGSATGLAVQEFTFRPFYAPLGEAGVGFGEPRTLAQRGVPVNHKVAQACTSGDSNRQEFAEWVIQATRTTPQTGSSQALIVAYTSAEEHHTLRIPFAITLCAPSDHQTPNCRSTA